MPLDRELAIEGVAEAAATAVFSLIWMGKHQLTQTESRLAYMLCIKKLIESVCIDRQSDVVAEWFKGKP